MYALQTAILRYLGKYELDKGRVLSEIVWKIISPPYDLRKFVDAEDDIDEKYNTEFKILTDKEYQKIVFRDPVKIFIPFLGADYYDEDIDDYPAKKFILKPDTPVGSTLKHTLEKVYRKMYGLNNKEKLKDAGDIFGEEFYYKSPYFEGFGTKKKQGEYKILLSSGE